MSLTRPERATEVNLARRHLAKVYRDPCGHCLHSDKAFGISICPRAGRTFPRCLSTPGLQFDPDHQKLNEGKS